MINRRFKNSGDVDYALNKVLQVKNYLFTENGDINIVIRAFNVL